MALPADGATTASTPDIKQHFVTREGYYRNLSTHEYSRPSRGAQSAALSGASPANGPVKMCLFQVNDDQESGYPDRLLFNYGREIILYAFKSVWEAPDLARPLDRQIFKAPPVCHDVNLVNCSAQGCSVLLGFSSGAFQITDPRKPESRTYNEDRLLDKGKVTCLKWVPGSAQQFLVGFSTGQLFHFDDSLPLVTVPPSYALHKHGEGYAVYTCKSRAARNPLYRWMIGEGAVNAVGFSPCNRYLAVASLDGYLRVFSFESLELLGTAKSYFGGLSCLSWSPDSKFICCAGEDDLVHLWSMDSKRIVARGRGHRSWVTAVSFDPVTSCLTQDALSRSGAGGDAPKSVAARPASESAFPSQRITTYRFASVGQDTQICLWELTDDIVKQSTFARLRTGSTILPAAPLTTSNLMPQPTGVSVEKTPKNEQNHRRNIPLLGGRFGDKSSHPTHKNSAPAAPTNTRSESRDESGKVPGSLSCPKLEDVPLLEPLVCKRIAPERLNDIVFHEDCILVSTQDGVIMTWSRPGRVPANTSSRQNSC